MYPNKPKSFDVPDTTPFWCARCECMLTEQKAEWVDDTPYCQECYEWLAARAESEAERAEEMQAEKHGAEV